MNSYLAQSKSSTWSNRRVEIAGIDLWMIVRINYVFVYSSILDIDRIQAALSDVLSLRSLVAGRLVCHENDRYAIDMTGNTITITIIENSELLSCPFSCHVKIGAGYILFKSFLDEFDQSKLMSVF
ncbi:unnamed protein product [Rotaria magnacalcarata]|uniref:Uncharacterized protein n=1 Tax=Rotaria magnacalcarata TaxID=392030 RepID=A0A816ZKT7_9BILA|nr:unnamed protein product [Rotaria magnacalcarata]CAF2218974.1 unnamed protein product [Rotaria magnacalcarata]CAF3848078.1 unnamed protein product [Rotaria magnacalcarata]CAF4074083.1 unnamed protein product [Rotaria magnacalcarata]